MRGILVEDGRGIEWMRGLVRERREGEVRVKEESAGISAEKSEREV